MYYYIFYVTIIILSGEMCAESNNGLPEVQIFGSPSSAKGDPYAEISLTCSGSNLPNDAILCITCIECQNSNCSGFANNEVFNYTIQYKPIEHKQYYCEAARSGKVIVRSEKINSHINPNDRNTKESEKSHSPEVKIFRSPPNAKGDLNENITFTCSGINLYDRSQLCLKYKRDSKDSYLRCSRLFSTREFNFSLPYIPTEKDNDFYCVARQDIETYYVQSNIITLQIQNTDLSKANSPSTDTEKDTDLSKTTSPPTDTGKDYLSYYDDSGVSNVTRIVLGILSVGLVVAFGVGYYYYRRHKIQKENMYTYATQLTYAQLQLDDTTLYPLPQVNQTFYTKIIGVFKPK